MPAALGVLADAELALPVSTPQPASANPATAMDDAAALRPDQVFLARQVNFAAMDGQSLAASWRSMVRNYGIELMNRDLRGQAGQLPPAVMLANQDGRVLRQPDGSLPADAWRFTVHTGDQRDHHLRVLREQPDQPPGRRRQRRAALRLEVTLSDGTGVVVQVEPMPGGVAMELCAPNSLALARLRAMQPMLEQAVSRAGLQVLRWRYRDTLPGGPVHARVTPGEADQVLTLQVFRAVAEVALLLPAVEDHAGTQHASA
jgi:hypothetical protein